jgi:uncharacterized membrane protein YgcG
LLLGLLGLLLFVLNLVLLGLGLLLLLLLLLHRLVGRARAVLSGHDVAPPCRRRRLLLLALVLVLLVSVGVGVRAGRWRLAAAAVVPGGRRSTSSLASNLACRGLGGRADRGACLRECISGGVDRAPHRFAGFVDVGARTLLHVVGVLADTEDRVADGAEALDQAVRLLGMLIPRRGLGTGVGRGSIRAAVKGLTHGLTGGGVGAAGSGRGAGSGGGGGAASAGGGSRGALEGSHAARLGRRLALRLCVDPF